MKVTKEARQLARRLLRFSMRDDRVERDRVSAVLKWLQQNPPRQNLATLQEYHRLLRLELSKWQAVVETAVVLSETSCAQVLQQIQSRYGDQVTAVFRENAALIGGIRIRVGSDVWDGSIRGRLEKLEAEFIRQ
ncbi:MAG: F0F1 ATP synthase subunit delta [Verrucomicrobiales bacterium]